ncbi:peptidyl-prolyl cis-trans isomerase FKBP17-1, chloroplastic-like, partial [Magnolia sinica]|uniref:peptidyl-prolyl cis-trans isomerase FKBP17-1, chloroplastic-like n=1 Tax=Magnolia sinica TaxID=86752 RepID=UPI0026594A74
YYKESFFAPHCNIFSPSFPRSFDASAASDFFELENSGRVKALDLRKGEGEVPVIGDQVAIHYYGRLAAKQGWRFDSTYDHKDEMGDTVPFIFVVGSGKVISGIEAAVKSMKVGGIRRVIIPPSQGYQNTSQEPIPPNFFDRQRLFTTIFNPTRLTNGEGSTLGTLIFDIELVSVRHPNILP